MRGADGAYRWFHSLSHLGRDMEGNPARWYGVMIDVDDRKRAEDKVEQAYLRLAEAQRLSKTGSFITDLLVDDHNWSEETFRIFEFDPDGKVTVQMIRDMVHPEDLLPFDTVISQGMKGIDVDFVFRIVTPRGAIKHIRGMARVISQIAGRPLFIGALQDVTESKIEEETLDKARSELAHVTRVSSLGVFTASIAHEVSQPLAGIITNASTCLRMLAADSPNVEGVRETARRIIRDAKRPSEVICAIPRLIRKEERNTEAVDLIEAAREVIALSLTELQRNRVILRTEFEEDLPWRGSNPVAAGNFEPAAKRIRGDERGRRSAAAAAYRDPTTRAIKCASAWRTPASVLIRREWIGCSSPSTQQKPTAWESVFPSAAQLSKATRAAYGQRRMRGRARRFRSRFRRSRKEPENDGKTISGIGG